MSKRFTLQKPNGQDLFDTDDQAIPVKVVSQAAGAGGLTDTELRAEPVEVIVTSMPAGGSGLTDSELRATAVPVSLASVPSHAVTDGGGSLTVDGSVAVSNFPATQPVSGTVGVSGSVAVTGTFWQATQPVSGTVTVGNASLAVTGTFWQATQPVSIASTVAVSGPLTDTQLRAVAVPVSGTFWQATQPVSGTFWQATQPVSIASLPALAAGTANIGDVDVLTLPALPAGTNNIGDVDIVSFPTLTKGTQGSTGVAVQPLRDAGRTLCTYTVSGLAVVSAEALIQLTPYKDLVAAGAATTFAVTGGKKLRLQTLIVTIRCTSTVNVGGIVRFRMLAGSVLVGSPVHFAIGGMSSNLATAVAGNAQTYFLDFPEGFELSGTMQFGLTQLFSATTATIDVSVVGYEY